MKTDPRDASARGGFSMAELVIAMGIMGIGLAMAAAIFPAALKQTEGSYNDLVGTMIAENGLAVARNRLAHLEWDPDAAPALIDGFNPDPNDKFEKIEQCELAYPPEDEVTDALDAMDPGPEDKDGNEDTEFYLAKETLRGAVVLVVKPDPSSEANDYVLISIAYEKMEAGHWVHLVRTRELTIEYDPGHADRDGTQVRWLAEGVEYPILKAAELPRLIGSPVIDRNTGKFATIVDVEDTTDGFFDPAVYLDHAIDTQDVSDPYLVLEKNADGEIIRSPALLVLSARVSLEGSPGENP